MTLDTICKQMKGDVRHSRFHTMIGVLLAMTGLFWLAKKVGWIPAAAGGSSIFWPVVVIVLAALIIFSARHKRERHEG